MSLDDLALWEDLNRSESLGAPLALSRWIVVDMGGNQLMLRSGPVRCTIATG